MDNVFDNKCARTVKNPALHLGSLMPAMKAVAEYYGDDIHEGDVIYHNDPVMMGSHILDCCMYIFAYKCTKSSTGQ
ncbi:MAG: hydantoinase B/oxoprolinase family protein [Psychrobacter celer]|uniref:hydantoinase B/oxoprolinase family protein n=1 Tax=Psychrobacter celer TaxID=306572 RepID=UPI003FB92288